MAKTVANDAPAIAVPADPNINSTPPMTNLAVPEPPISLVDPDRWQFNGDNSPQPPQSAPDTFDFSSIPMQNNFTWEMIGLGLEEPLPPQDSIDELSGRLTLARDVACVSRG